LADEKRTSSLSSSLFLHSELLSGVPVALIFAWLSSNDRLNVSSSWFMDLSQAIESVVDSANHTIL
jgi:F0F1-type ATP synthase assembly protein I